VSGEKKIRVIGAGFGRTGTLSIKYALEDLGYGPCYIRKVKIAAYTAVILILLGMISVLLNFLFNF